jgi:uncharacterized protein YjdB
MNKYLKKVLAIFMVVLTLLTFAPLQTIADTDWGEYFNFKSNAFSTMTNAVKASSSEVIMKDMIVTSVNYSNTQYDDLTLQTQSITMGIGDSEVLFIDVVDKDGNPVENFGTIYWSAYPSDAVKLDVHADTRYCGITILDTEHTSVTIYATLNGQSISNVISISNNEVRFSSSEYYILVDSTVLTSSFSLASLLSSQATWTYTEEKLKNIDESDYVFESSDSSILKVTGKSHFSTSKSHTLSPKVLGVKEGEVTLTVKTSSGATDTCKVVVVGYKEYKIEAFSTDLETPLSNAKIGYENVDLYNTASEIVVKTGKDGIVIIKIPDVKYYEQDITVTARSHIEITISSSELKEIEINKVELKFDIQINDNVLSNVSISGPTKEVDNESFSLFNFSAGVDFDFSNIKALGLDFKVDTKEKTVEVLFGLKEEYLNTDKKWNECYENAKTFYESIGGSFYPDGSNKNNIANNTYKKLHEKLKANKYEFIVKVDGGIFGFLKFNYSSGEPKLFESGAVLTASIDFEKNVPWFTGVYVKFGFGVDAEGRFTWVYEESGNLGWNISVQFGMNGRLGIGVGCDAIGIDVNAKLEFTIKIQINKNIKKMADALEAYFTGSIYLEGHVDFWVIKLKAKLVEWHFDKKFYIFPFDKFGLQSNSVEVDDEIEFVLIDRDYLESECFVTNSVGSKINFRNVYPYGKSQIVELDDGRLLAVWLNDDGAKSSANCTTLVYSIYEDGVWSTSEAIYESGRADYTPCVVADGNNAYVIWQRNSEVLSDNVTFDDYMKKTELVYSCFKDNKWSAPMTVAGGNNGKYKSLYSLAYENGTAVISWVENSENDYMLINGTNTVYKQELVNNIAGSREVVAQTNNRIYSLASGFSDKESVVAYSVDVDSDTETYDGDIYLNATNITSDTASDVVLKYQDGKFYWLKDGYLSYYDKKVNKTNLLVNSNDYAILKNADTDAVVMNKDNGYQSELAISYLNDDNSYTNPVNLTSYGQRIGDYDVVLTDNGKIFVSANIRNINTDLENGIYSSTDFIVDEIESEKKATISDVWYDLAEVIPGEKLAMNVVVANEGNEIINTYKIKLKDEIGNTVATFNFYDELLQGESKEVEIKYNVPKDLTRRNLKLTVTTDNEVESEAYVTAVGYADIKSMTHSIENNRINGYVMNAGYDKAENVCANIYYFGDGAEKELINTITIGDIASGQSGYLSYDIPEDYLTFESYLAMPTFYVEYTLENEDSDYSNNNFKESIEPIRVEGMNFADSNVFVTLNDSIQLQTIFEPIDATDKTVYWFVEDTDIVEVNQDGVILPKAYGTTTVKGITSDGRFEDTCTVTVTTEVPVTGISMESSTVSILKGQSRKLVANVLPVNATNKTVVWSSGNTNIATVSADGVVTAKNTGTTTITAKTYNGRYSATCTVAVVEESINVTGVSLNKTDAILNEGDAITLTAKVEPINATNTSVKWSSSNTGVAKVNSSGKVTAVAPGSAIITVKTDDGNYTAYCRVTVNATKVPVSGVVVTPNTVYLNVAEEQQISVKVSPLNATDKSVKWSSSDASVAAVSDNGTVKAIKPGVAIITVTTNDGGLTDICEVVVSDNIKDNEITSVRINTVPNMVEYKYKFKGGANLYGLTLEVQYSDGSKEIITDTSLMTVTGFDTSSIGNKTLTVEYKGFTTTYDITVKYTIIQWILVYIFFGWIWYK